MRNKRIILALLSFAFLLTGCGDNEIDTIVEEKDVALEEETPSDEILSEQEITEQLKLEGYIIESVFIVPGSKILGVGAGPSSNFLREKLDNEKISYKLLCKKFDRCDYLTVSNYVIHVNSHIEEIYLIKDKGGSIIDPSTIQLLTNFADQDAKEAEEAIISSINENRQQSSGVIIGMTTEEVKRHLGSPQDINRTITANSVSEQWIYPSSYLYFENGILTIIQD